MIDPAPPLNSNSLIATGVLKLLGELTPVLAPPPPPSTAPGTSPIVSSGPIGTIKDPTANSAMSIVQLAQHLAEGDVAVPAAPGDVSREAVLRTYAWTVEQEYAANNAEPSTDTPHDVPAQTWQAAASGTDVAPGVLPHHIEAQAVFQPYLFFATDAYLQRTSGKLRTQAKKLRASWRFLLQKDADPDECANG